MTTAALGQMFFIFNKVIMARSSYELLFYKLSENEDTGVRKWEQYHAIDKRGQVYYIKDNYRI